MTAVQEEVWDEFRVLALSTPENNQQFYDQIERARDLMNVVLKIHKETLKMVKCKVY